MARPAEAADEGFAVLPCNWEVVLAFCALQSQWRYAPSGAITGLDYAGCRVALSALGMNFKAVFAGLQVMEAEVLRLVAMNDSHQ